MVLIPQFPLHVLIKKLQRSKHGIAKIFGNIMVVAFVLVILHDTPRLQNFFFKNLRELNRNVLIIRCVVQLDRSR